MKKSQTKNKKTITQLKRTRTKTGNKPIKAIANLIGDNVSGHVIFTEMPHLGKVKIEVELSGLESGLHGFHIHEAGNIAEKCKGCCAHFNPTHQTHGGIDSKIRHVGDLGNIDADRNKKVSTILYDKIIKLRGKHSIIGRSVVVHGGQDDLGLGGNDESLKTGNAGSREACGVVGYYEAYYF